MKFKDGCDIKQEDVVIIVNHLDQIISLLINFADKQCLEYLLKEKILDQLCHLSLNCDKNGSDLRVKQLRIYKVLISKFHSCILNNEGFLSPLSRLLISCHENVFSLDVEKILVSLLHQLCITLFQQNELLEFFFPSQHEKQNTSERFVILSLLVSYIHREEELGRQARDALLLCLALSKDNTHVAQFIIQDSDLCPVLATGLSGLYSSLPRKLDVDSDEWHRFSHEDVNNIPELSAFMLSLDFCNVVIQKSHVSVQNELLELLYKGFLEPVLGPALMQTTDDELVVATAYLELFVRSVSHPGVLHSFVKFILTATYENKRVIDCLIQRINASYRLSLVTLALLETLVDSNCEDVLLTLVFKPLIPCSHVMLSQRSRLTHLDPFAKSATKFLSLIPRIGKTDDRSEVLGSNYYAYLAEARGRIEACYRGTSMWTYPYDGESPPHCSSTGDDVSKLVPDAETELTSLPSADDGSSGYESFKTCDRPDEESVACGSPCRGDRTASSGTGVGQMMNATPSIGPFLDTLLTKLESMPIQDLHTNLLITSILSRLAIYPQPLIHSFLLDHSLVFQPSIRSLFQILSGLKQKLESQLQNEKNIETLTKEAEKLLLEREERLSSPRVNSGSQSLGNTPSAFERFDSKRKSFSDTIGGFFKRSKEPQLESCSQGYRFINRSSLDSPKKNRRAVLCAILLSEWLKELAAITQEHTVCSLSIDLMS